MPTEALLLTAATALVAALIGFVFGRRRIPRQATLARPSELQFIFDATPAFIWHKDLHNRILNINAPAAGLLGKTPGEVRGTATEDHYPEEAAAYYADDLEVIRSGRAKLGIVEPLALGSGEKRWIRTDKLPFRDETGDVSGVIVFSLDITELKVAEQRAQSALEASERAGRAKSDFLANVSHEIRTPLGVIMGFSELMQSPKLDAPTRQAYTDKILRNGRRLLKLIDEILDLAKVEQGRLALELVAFDLGAFLADIASQSGAAARAKGLSFTLKQDPALPTAIVTDATRLRQILGNVLDNALKFTEKGGLCIDVTASAASSGYPEDVVLTFDVRDTGKGLAQTAVERLFRPFEQSDPTVARKYGGAGLGLSLSRRLAQALKGELDLVETAPGQGSLFRLRIPARRVDPREITPIEPSAGRGYVPQGAVVMAAGDVLGGKVASLVGLKILLVEDNPDIQEMVRLFLREEGCELLVAVSGREGVDLARTHLPHLVLMDLQLPELDGIGATAELRKGGFRSPIVAMTAHAMKGQRQACIEQGFDDFLSKPLSKSDLMAKIYSFTSHTRAP